jgi:hypothetical protein
LASIIDAHRHVKTGLSAEVDRFSDGEALSERIREWLETPEGTVADLPDWGHNIIGYKHDPQSTTLAVAIEMSIAQKMTRDIKNLKLLGVGVEFLEIDLFRILIRHQFGGTIGTLQL